MTLRSSDLGIEAVSPTGAFARITTQTGILFVRYVDGITETVTLPPNQHASEATALSFSADGTMLAVSTKADAILVFTLPDWALAATLPTTGNVYQLAFSPDHSLLGARHADGTLLVWRIGEMKPISRIVTPPLDPEQPTPLRSSLLVTPDQKMVITGDGAGVTFYRLQDGQRLQTIPVAANDVAMTSDARWLMIVDAEGVDLWGVP